MKIGLQFAMPAELHALPGAKDLEPFETVSGVPFYQVAPDIIACASGISKVNAAMGAEILCLKYGVVLIPKLIAQAVPPSTDKGINI